VSFIDSVIISAHSKQAFQSAADEVYILMEHCSGSFTTARACVASLCLIAPRAACWLTVHRI
jgi:hypothetical protein